MKTSTAGRLASPRRRTLESEPDDLYVKTAQSELTAEEGRKIVSVPLTRESPTRRLKNSLRIAATTVSRTRNAHPPTNTPGIFSLTIIIASYLFAK
jgi:hypothetical protein